MAVNLNSFVWPSMGIEPPDEEDVIYTAGEQPVAGFDNHVMWAVTDDLNRLRDWAASHGSVHEAGGAQEINIGGLSVGNVAVVDSDDAADEYRIEDETGTAAVRYDIGDGYVRSFLPFATQTQHNEGIDVRNDIVRGDGTVIYDATSDYFHRAFEADHATTADEADNSDTLDGYDADAFLFPSDDATITGNWTFDNLVDADISGNAATANHADEADHADTADEATLALDSNHLEGKTVQEILDMVEDDVLTGKLIDVQDDGVEVLSDASDLDFGTSIDVSTSGTTATMDVTSVPHADEAEYAINSDKVDNYHAQELIDEAVDTVKTDFVNVADDGSVVVDSPNQISFDQSMDVSQKAPGIAGVDVSSVPHADEAEYAYNSDKVDNMHAQEIIDEAVSKGGGEDGRWTFIDDWQVGGPDTPVDWEVDFHDEYGNTYDIYKLVLVHENASNYEGWKWFKFNLNFDFRFRYEFSSEVRASDSSSDWNISLSSETYASIDLSHSLQISTGFHHWPICPAKPNQRGVSEYKIANPQTMMEDTERKPHIAVEHYNGPPDADNNLQRGKLDTEFDDIYAFSLESGHPAEAYIQVWGTQLDIVT